jgi:hypothetical protein
LDIQKILKKMRADLKNSGDKHLVSLEATVSDEQLVRLADAFNKTDGTPEAVIKRLAS